MTGGGAKVIGLEKLHRRFQEAAAMERRKVLQTLSDIGNNAVKEADDRAPIDMGTLTHDIEKSVQVDNNNLPGVIIRVPLNAPSSDYAVSMHEDEYNLGPRSKKKAARTGKQIGRKYITRGIDASKTKVEFLIKSRHKI